MRQRVIVLAAVLVLVLGGGTTLAQKPTLEIWGRASFAPAQAYWFNSLAYEWGAANGVDVKITWIPVADMSPKLATAIASGTEPDMVIGGYPTAKFAEADLLLPLDDLVDKLGRDDFFEIKLKQGTVDGKVYSIPSGFELSWMHVRKDILEKAGVLDLLPFENEEGVLIAAEKANQVEPGVYGIGLPLGGSGADCYWTFQIYYYGFGGGFLSDRSVEGAVFGKEPNRSIAKKTFAFEKDIYDRGLTPPDSGEWVDISNNMAFLEGRVAMTSNPMSIWYGIMTGKPDLVPKTMIYPDAFPIDQGDESNFIFSSTPYPDLAKDLLYTFFGDKEVYRQGWCEQSQLYNLPVFKSQMQVLSENWKQGMYPFMGMDPYEAAMRTKFHTTPMAYPLGEASSVMEDLCWGWVINDMVIKAVIKEEDFDKVIDEFQVKLEDMVREAYGR